MATVMATRYTPDELKRLRESPLVAKPTGLPPAEQWMGPPADLSRNSTKSTDRNRNDDHRNLLDQTNRRPGVERHMSRNSANPEDIILGPPKTSFLSATSMRNAGKGLDSPDRSALRDLDRGDRFNRTRVLDGEHDRAREGRNGGLRPKRTEGDQDSDGWSTVKPRKSFGAEGAERFNGRMGVDRLRDERRFKDREERDTREPRDTRDRPRGFDSYSREKEGEQDLDRDSRRNGGVRARNEPSWLKDRDNKDEAPAAKDRNSNGDRYMDRSRGWREKERDDRFDKGDRNDRGGDRGDRGDRRWGDRDRQEREPEWMDEPAEGKSQQRTQEDLQRWKEQMRGKDNSTSAPVEAEDRFKPDAGASFFGLDSKLKVETPLEIESGPDKFFGMWSAPAPKPEPGLEEKVEVKEIVPKAKPVGKASRFTSFFAAPEEPQRPVTEPPISQTSDSGPLGLAGSTGSTSSRALTKSSETSGSDPAEQLAFSNLLARLKRTAVSPAGSAPPVNAALQPKPPVPERQPPNARAQQEIFQIFQQSQQERQEDNRPSTRNSQQHPNDFSSQRQINGHVPEILQNLVGQRSQASSQASSRPSQPQNSDQAFLMDLLKSGQFPGSQRVVEQPQMRVGPTKAQSERMQLEREMIDREFQREAALQRERQNSASQPQHRPQQQGRPQAPPGFFDEPLRGPPQHEGQQNQRQPAPQPTQILQRPQPGPPPGLDYGWQPPPQQQHRIVAPPPGLQAGINMGQNSLRGGMPMFPPGYPMGPGPNSFPPPTANEIMGNGPRGLQMMNPPPGFFPPGGGPPPPPPGFMGFGGPGGDFGGGLPGLPGFDGRGVQQQGFRRQ